MVEAPLTLYGKLGTWDELRLKALDWYTGLVLSWSSSGSRAQKPLTQGNVACEIAVLIFGPWFVVKGITQ
jgi:hypothetical protein